jgi:choline dehydrogenase
VSHQESYRFIIVGAGSAGCVLANRLSTDPRNHVLLLEAGGRDINPFIHMPAGLARLVNNTRINWGYHTEAERELNGRKLFWPRGKVLGGSSSINAMCYIRGQREDYDGWAAVGNSGWSYDDVLPYFRRSEDQQRGESKWHGVGGHLAVQDLRYRNPLSQAFVEAAQAIGLKRNDDFNGEEQEGVGFYQVTQHNGRRCSGATGYLAHAKDRANLRIITHALAQRILFDKQRAIGVEYVRNGQLFRAMCDDQIILCGGAINSPQLLMLSGIGPAPSLHALGIDVIVDLVGVGENLQDHLDLCTLYKTPRSTSYDFNKFQEGLVALRYLATANGPGTSNIAEAGGFVCSQYAARSTDGSGRPDIQLHFVPAQLDDHGRNRLPGHGYTLHACFLRPESRGRIRLRTNAAIDAPLIEANYLTQDRDLSMSIEAVRISREILRAQPLDLFRGPEVFPGATAQSDAAIAEFVRRKAESIYHPVGTCRMGNDASAVVDDRLRVRGVDGLRVVDASIMPTLVSGNTNAPTMMIAEKAADLLLA